MVIDLDLPVVQAPMAGGPSTPSLAAAVSSVGGLGFLAAGYKSPEAVLADITATRELTQQPFGVNVFAPSGGPADRDTVNRYADRLRDQAAALGVVLGDPRFDDDHYQQKVQLLVQERVAVVSFTFGCPAPSVVQRLQQVGTSVWVTVTDPQEAVQRPRRGRTRSSFKVSRRAGTADPSPTPTITRTTGSSPCSVWSVPGSTFR